MVLEKIQENHREYKEDLETLNNFFVTKNVDRDL